MQRRDFPAKSAFTIKVDLPATGNASGWRRLKEPRAVQNNQAFAWNPSIRGGKAEDTVILHDGVIENLTSTPELPVLSDAIVEGSTYAAAGVLIR